MKINILESASLILATVILTVLAMKYFGPQLGVTIDQDGVAANSTVPLTFCLLILGVFKGWQRKRTANEGVTNA